ncbi:hypothetical protein I4641_05545 [Waterburya agarophytonicola K14]|uniref:Uncharacterized protein n=1 Tax=Waterburya agarophytonicola KI4 TaxID=2874699 RepID=A0A964FF10_9CYAN|nr:hypothetical protein [Waterburya agarophytonicola]MCC0176441.1 hypothetical protein [Waterburya agarophytonicola KI4]
MKSEKIVKETNLEIPSIPNVSLVAFYGHKSPQLKELIQQLQREITSSLGGDSFIPYQLEQVHATVIGCEGLKTQSGVINKWFCDRRQETRYIDFPGLINYLQHQVDLPLTIRFGGYDRDGEYNYFSRNEHLYYRSFQLQPAKEGVIPILIGWSWQDNRVTLGIDKLRRNFQQFNLLHKYHETTDAIDNDFYLRLGTINCQSRDSEIQAIANNIRSLLETQSPLSIPVKKNNLAFARYQDLSLTPTTTKIIPIAQITANLLEEMYPV